MSGTSFLEQVKKIGTERVSILFQETMGLREEGEINYVYIT